MSEKPVAIEVKNLTQYYTLFPNAFSMCMEIFKINKLLFWKKKSYPIKKALDNLNFTIYRGERIGLIGRNGAGKTTLLKILTGILPPTKGIIQIHGHVQSLMTSGLGFHPEFTGYQNIKASLIYNNLNKLDFEEAINDIIDFCELGDYLHQPFKTYSLGMQSRLAFATATAIRPEILIIDEVLGAGDAYFTSKSAERIKKLTENKETTFILVSHSNGQILKFCNKCIWINDGKIERFGETLTVIKEYDKFINSLEQKNLKGKNEETNKSISRWVSRGRSARIEWVKILNVSDKEESLFNSGDTIKFSFRVMFTNSMESFYPVVFIYTEMGIPVSLCHKKIESSNHNNLIDVDLTIAECNLGPGNYVCSVAVYKNLDYFDINNSEYIDLIDRSFSFKIIDPVFRSNPALINLKQSWITK